MIQEYLFSDKENRTKVEEYSPPDIERDFTDFDSSECWMVSYFIPHNNEETAKILSDVNAFITQNYHPTVLSNGSAEYFNKMLFPLINEFERKLRKLLYLKSALNKDEKARENIQDLEEKDLGKIFEFLFTDENFIREVKSKVKTEITWPFAKSEFISILDSIKEETLWDKLLGRDSVPALRENYLVVKSYRNDIMHAHNISYSAYKDAKSLFQKVNSQLDSEIGIVIATAEKQPEHTTERNYNATLGDALIRANLQESLLQIVQQMNMIRTDYAPAIALLKEWEKSLSDAAQISKPAVETFLKSIQPLTELQKLRETYEAIQPLTISQETLDAFKRASELFPKAAPEIDDTEDPDKENEEKA